MKLKFKNQAYQTAAVEAVADCLAGQPLAAGLQYRVDPGRPEAGAQPRFAQVDELGGFRNAELRLTPAALLANVQAVQRRGNLPLSASLVASKVCDLNFDIEMETGTGKTYCYIKTMFELHKRYGWSKFIVVVPSIAIREGVYKSFEITAEHFLEAYGKRARFFIYNSKQLHNLESYSSDAGVNAMIINVQAFNARGEDARRIYEELDDFQSRRPIDVIKANRPILILDEPQKMEGKNTLDSLAEFNPLMVLRYSATHRTQHNKVHRLDALDAYNQKLVKKIAVRGVTTRGLSGTNGYLYLESIEVSANKPPVARAEMEVQIKTGIKREVRKLGRNDDLHQLSGGLKQYKGFVVADIDARTDTVSFTNGQELRAGEASGDVNEATLRRIQIREAIRAHLEKEQALFERGVKVLTLFFIDEVAKYRQYDEAGEQPGEYARIFEEEYGRLRDEAIELFTSEAYKKYLQGIDIARTHNGYFSIDKKSNRLVDPKAAARGELAGQTDDVDAYDLILKDKERLLSFEEPVRFIFSHSALREGWDNPNVFVIGTLKHSDNTISQLWGRINQKAAYTVHFETPELIGKCVRALDRELTVAPLQYTVQRGEQADEATIETLEKREAFKLQETETTDHKASVHSAVPYDLLGTIAERTQLKHATVAAILTGIQKVTFDQYKMNPEDFRARIINEQKATVIIEHLAYDPIQDRHDVSIFTHEKPKDSFAKAKQVNRHIYDYVFTDSKNERDFVSELDTSAEVEVYSKLPRSFFIPTPVGNYNPDWAIAFKQGTVRHVYFIAETKGSMSTLDLRNIEESKIECARKFFAKITSDRVKYDVVDSYAKLMELVT